MYNPFLFPLYTPWLPNDCDKPPTIYSLLESIVNYGKDDKEKIKDLAKTGRTTFFNFNYPLSTKINKEDFECMILNHFLMRRIGYDTLTAFRIQLNVKLNEIMPMYNKLFDALDGWELFEDGEKIERESNYNGSSENTTKTETEETKNGTSKNTNNTTSTNNTSNVLNNTSTSQNINIIDRRNSELPQSEIENVQNASYLTDYTFENNTSNGSDNSESTGSSETSGTTNTTINGTTEDSITGEINGMSNTTDINKTTETIKRTPSDKMKIYTEFIENKQNIYSMIFKDLDCLFYQLI